MDLTKTLLTLLAIFCVIASAGAACAADVDAYLERNYADDMSGYAGSQYDDNTYADAQTQDEGGYAGSQYEDGGYAGSNYRDDGGWAGSQYNESEENGGWAGSQYNQTLEDSNANANTTSPLAAGEPTNITANATNSHTMLATGNPILLLLGVCAVLGGCTVLRRR